MSQEGWRAKWIAWKNPEEDADRAGIRWIWVAGQDALSMAARTVAQFRIDVDMGEKPRNAALFLLARGAFVAKVNGQQVGAKKEWYEFDREAVTEQRIGGTTSSQVQVTATEPKESGPA